MSLRVAVSNVITGSQWSYTHLILWLFKQQTDLLYNKMRISSLANCDPIADEYSWAGYTHKANFHSACMLNKKKIEKFPIHKVQSRWRNIPLWLLYSDSFIQHPSEYLNSGCIWSEPQFAWQFSAPALWIFSMEGCWVKSGWQVHPHSDSTQIVCTKL